MEEEKREREAWTWRRETELLLESVKGTEEMNERLKIKISTLFFLFNSLFTPSSVTLCSFYEVCNCRF